MRGRVLRTDSLAPRLQLLRLLPRSSCCAPEAAMKMTSSLPLCTFFALLLSAPLLVSSEGCMESDNSICHAHAYCADTVNDECECYSGALDLLRDTPGTQCSENGFSVRYVMDATLSPAVNNLTAAITSGLCEDDAIGYYIREVDPAFTEVSCLYDGPTNQAATDALAWYETKSDAGGFPGDVTAGPSVKRWAMPTVSNPIPVEPTGMEITTVSFQPVCGSTGCWVVKGKLTTGEALKDSSSFNTLFLPHAQADGAIPGDVSYDTDYHTKGNNLGSQATGVEWTFEPANHPCQSADFDTDGGITQEVTTCCIKNRGVGYMGAAGAAGSASWTNSPAQRGGFVTNYRPVQAFVTWADSLEDCVGADGEVIDRPGYNETEQGTVVDVAFPSNPRSFLLGTFSGLNDTRVANLTELDPFSGQYGFELHLDEEELRSYAGKLIGTVGVEHTVDTFIGFANFRTTGLVTLDTFATQAALHLEKTNFFTVSTHGVNDYTFLRYINLRLVEVLVEDTDFSGNVGFATNDDEGLNRTVRTSRDNNVAYVQVTFTLDPKFGVNNVPNDDKYTSGLIPLDSVRVGLGTFVEETTLVHACQEYALLEDSPDGVNGTIGLGYVGKTIRKGTFDDTVALPCGPVSSMCVSPSAIPDSFVSFNIPLGSEIFDDTQSNNLDSNVFVHMVINAIDEEAREENTNPNGGGAPWQAKTTLTASIPIVAGGINVFCDAFVAKTDLNDIASVDLLLGTSDRSPNASLTRRLLQFDDFLLDDVVLVEDIGDTSLSPATVVDTEASSVESAQMTLVIDGDPAFFDETLLEDPILRRRSGRRAANTMAYSIEVEDMFTIHLMEEGRAPPSNPNDFDPNDSSIGAQVAKLFAEPAEDNSDEDGLQTEGYNLNGAFDLHVNRALGQGELQPREALTRICPFNARRPTPLALVNEVCITRREIRTRVPQKRPGAPLTAIEIGRPTGVDPALSDEAAVQTYLDSLDPASALEAEYMASVIGDSTYARNLALNYARSVASHYRLNGRFRRAFWINPAYEWGPQATGGRPTFSISSRIYLFALVSLDENWDRRRGQAPPAPRTPRFKLLQVEQNALQEQSSAVNSVSINNKLVTPKTMLADAFGVSPDAVAYFDVKLQLTNEQACMPPADRQGAVREVLEGYVAGMSEAGTASATHSLQVLAMTIELNGYECLSSRRRARKLLAADALMSPAVATVKMAVVFKEAQAQFELAAFKELKGVSSVRPDANNAMSFSESEDSEDTQIGGSGAKQDAPEDEGDDDAVSTTLIAGICGGVGGLLVLVAGAVFYMRSASTKATEAAVVQRTASQSLKEQLELEVRMGAEP